MKKVCFIVSHLGSGSQDLLDILNENPRCSIENSQTRYSNPEDLNWLFSKPHKCRDSSAIYGDHILFNPSFSCKSLYNVCKFIYIIRPPRQSLNQTHIFRKSGLEGEFAAKYYSFRLRRICEMARKTPNSLLLTWDDLSSGRAFSSIEEYLKLSTQLKVEYRHFCSENRDEFDESLLAKCEDAYERYYYYLSKLEIKRPIF